MTPINDKPLRVPVMLDFDREELRKRLAEECEERISGQRRRLLGVQRRLLWDEWRILGDQWGKIGEELGSGFWDQILWKIARLLGVQQQKQQASRIGTWHSACITAAMITWGIDMCRNA